MAKHAFALGISDALVELVATRCRGAEVEPARSALAFIEALWSSEEFAGEPMGRYGRALLAVLAAAAAECSTPQLLVGPSQQRPATSSTT